MMVVSIYIYIIYIIYIIYNIYIIYIYNIYIYISFCILIESQLWPGGLAVNNFFFPFTSCSNQIFGRLDCDTLSIYSNVGGKVLTPSHQEWQSETPPLGIARLLLLLGAVSDAFLKVLQVLHQNQKIGRVWKSLGSSNGNWKISPNGNSQLPKLQGSAQHLIDFQHFLHQQVVGFLH